MVSKTALHMISALAALAQLPPGAYAGAGEIARQIGAPHNYLGKLLQGLIREGLVESQKGKGGGFRLAREAQRIALFDVVEPIDHVSRFDGCFLSRASCEGRTCAVHARWATVCKTFFAFLRQTTIADLAKMSGTHRK